MTTTPEVSMTPHAIYQREWRAKKGARTGANGPAPSAPCGTPAAYKRHVRHGEETDQACRDAWAELQRKQYLKRKKRKQKAEREAARAAKNA